MVRCPLQVLEIAGWFPVFPGLLPWCSGMVFALRAVELGLIHALAVDCGARPITQSPVPHHTTLVEVKDVRSFA